MPLYAHLQCAQYEDGSYVVSIDGNFFPIGGPSRDDIALWAGEALNRANNDDFFSPDNMYGAIFVSSFEGIWESADVIRAVTLFTEKCGVDYPMKYVVILTKEGKAVYTTWRKRKKKSKYVEAY